MPNLGPAEILVIMVVALLVFGPDKLPEIGRQVGRAMRDFRRFQVSLRDEVRDVLEPTPTPKPPRGMPPQLPPASPVDAHPKGDSEGDSGSDSEGDADDEVGRPPIAVGEATTSAAPPQPQGSREPVPPSEEPPEPAAG